MENGKVGGGGDKPTTTDVTTATTELGEEQNPNSTSTEEVAAVPIRQSSRTPFTNLSQVDADLALARTLQEQERAYMMLAMNNEGSDYGSWETGSYSNEEAFDDPNDDTDAGDVDGDENEDGGTDVDDDDDDDDDDNDDEEDEDDDEDAFDVHAHDDFDEDDIPSVEIDPSAYPDDEAYARALQDAEEREMASRLLALAGLNDRIIGVAEDVEDHGGDLQDTWEEVDPDELSYEELLALGDVIGTESRGLSSAKIASLPSINYKAQNNQNGINDSCVICRLDFEDGDTLTVLSCKHSYHSECINNWLQINKVCPVCSTEVSTSEIR